MDATFVDLHLTVSVTREVAARAEKLPVKVVCGASRGSPVQEHELLLVGVPTQARADLQGVVVIGVKPGAADRTHTRLVVTVATHTPLSPRLRYGSLVQRVQEDSHRLATDVHHLQDDDDVIARYDLQGAMRRDRVQ